MGNILLRYIGVYADFDTQDAVKIAVDAIKGCDTSLYDTVIIDTAGRLHIDEALMEELRQIKKNVHPTEILLVVDSMTGQDAVNVAASFDEQLGIDGIILTKLDGDTRGGAALSVRATTGKNIKFYENDILDREALDKIFTNENIEAVIFDLDGTLLNTLYDLTDAVNWALEKYGQPTRSMEEVRSFVGNGLRNLMLQAVPDGDENPVFEELFEFFREYYKNHCNIKTAPYDGVLELMKELKARGVKMAIVSNKIDSGVKELNANHFGEFIEVAIGEREGIGRKPAPDSVNEALRILNVDKEHAVYVGDSDVDIQTAKNAEVRCISVSWGFRDEAFLMENGAGIMIDRPLELLEYL